MHMFCAIKINNFIIINLHLQAENNNKMTEVEFLYLLNRIIPKEEFFKMDNIDKIFIIGDLNMDTGDIVENLNDKIKNKFYKNKIFKVILNNIITRTGTGTGLSNSCLDNCIIIEKLNKKCENYEPQIYVSDNKYNPVKNDNLSDHSMIAFEINDNTGYSNLQNEYESSNKPSKISKSASKTISSSLNYKMQIEELKDKIKKLEEENNILKQNNSRVLRSTRGRSSDRNTRFV